MEFIMVSRNINRKAMHNLIVRVCIVLLFTFLVVSITVEGNNLNTITGNAPRAAPVICATDDDCTLLQFCADDDLGGICTEKKSNSQACTNPVECISNLCTLGVCKASAPVALACDDNVCGAGEICRRVVQFRVGGRDLPIAQHRFLEGAELCRAKLVVGSPCERHAHCASDRCIDGRCVVAPPPQACNADANCGAGLRCFSRVCQTQVCSETDSGNDPATAGILTLDRSITEDIATKDACGDDRMLTEYYCTQNGGSTRQSVACPQGTTCQMNAEQVGACVAAPPIVGGGDGNNQHQETDDNTAGTSNYFRRMERFNTLMRR